jgi:ribosomal protein L19E
LARRRKYIKKKVPSRRSSAKRPTWAARTKKRMLNMGRVDSFRYELKKLLEGMPKEEQSSTFGTIYSKASTQSIDSAKEFVEERVEEGKIDEDLSREVLDLLSRYSRMR